MFKIGNKESKKVKIKYIKIIFSYNIIFKRTMHNKIKKIL